MNASNPDEAIEEPIEATRLRVLMPYIKAHRKVRALVDENGNQVMKPLEPDLAQLEITLDASRSWIRGTVRFVAEVVGWKNANADHFRFKERTGGAGKTRRPIDIDDEIRRAIAYACDESGLESGTPTAILRARQHLETVLRGTGRIVPSPRQIAEVMRSGYGAIAHAGPYLRDHLNRVTKPRERPDALRTCVILDWTGFSQDHRQLIALTDDDRVIGRLTLISALEEVTRIPWGWQWCAGAANSDLVGYCIANGILSKEPLLRKWGFEGQYPASGRPLVLVHDNGSDMKSDHTKAVTSEAGIRFDQRIPVKTPHFDGKLERFHGTAKSLFLDFLEDLKLRPDSEKSYPPGVKTNLKRGHIYIRWSELERTWLTWVLTKYITRPHKGIDMEEISPLRRYEELINGEGYHMAGLRKPVEDGVDFQWAFLWRTPIRHFDGAINIDGRKYFCNVLSRIIPNASVLRKSPLEVRWNRYNLREVYVRDPETREIVAVPLVDPPDLPDCSYWEWQSAVCDFRRVYNLKPSPIEIAELLRKRAEEFARGPRKPPVTLNRSDTAQHLMHAIHRERFNRYLLQGPPRCEPLTRGCVEASKVKSGEVPRAFPSARQPLGAGGGTEFLMLDRVVRI